MLHIKEQTNGINSQKDTKFLEKSHYCLLNNLSKLVTHPCEFLRHKS